MGRIVVVVGFVNDFDDERVLLVSVDDGVSIEVGVVAPEGVKGRLRWRVRGWVEEDT